MVSPTQPTPPTLPASLLADPALGPLAPLLADLSIMEIIINGPGQIFAERSGQLQRIDTPFESDAALRQAIRTLTGAEHILTDEAPIAEFRLPDGSQLKAVSPPIATDGTAMVFRRTAHGVIHLSQLIQFGALTEPIAAFLQACVRSRLNILVSGGTASGKTTLANILIGMIAPEERLIVVEQNLEFLISHPHVVRLEARPPNRKGPAEITMQQLVELALTMRPERLILGELNGPETWSFLQACQTGHDGSLTLMHATSPRDSLGRIERMMLMAEPTVPLPAIRDQIAASLNLIVQINRLSSGVRRITSVSEVVGIEGEEIALREIFSFVQDGIDSDGQIIGRFQASGIRPRFLQRLANLKQELPEGLFDPPETAATVSVPPGELSAADIPALDRQLGETVTLLALLLRSGYSFSQCINLLASELPAPVSTALQSLLSDFEQQYAPDSAFERLLARIPSVYLRALADITLRQYREGGNLANLLDPLAEQIRSMAGADPATDQAGIPIRRHVGAALRTTDG